MAFSLRKALLSGVQQFREHPQLYLTIIVAVSICGSYLFVADRFLGIAKDAQDELVNVRVGALQDAFAPLASELESQPDILRAYMRRMQELNPTIVNFDIVNEAGDVWAITLSSDMDREGERVFRQDLVLSLAASDPSNSFTVEEVEGGERFFFTARAIQDREGEVTGVVLTRQTLSAADQRIKSNLTNAVVILMVILVALLGLFFKHARIIDYTVLYRKLREVDNLKDEFISMASHELRAPLTAIRGYTEMLKDGTLAQDQKALSLERIDLSAKQLDNLIVDMLDVSKIEQGRITVNLAPLVTEKLLGEIAENWRSVAEQKGLAFSTQVAQGLTISADPDRFRQVVINLLSNAVKYTPKGSVTVESKEENGSFVLTISDTGLGMTEEERNKLFGKFYRAGGREVRDQPGTGLGLWITKQLVELMGGKISVESIKGVGSHFILTFPILKS